MAGVIGTYCFQTKINGYLQMIGAECKLRKNTAFPSQKNLKAEWKFTKCLPSLAIDIARISQLSWNPYLQETINEGRKLVFEAEYPSLAISPCGKYLGVGNTTVFIDLVCQWTNNRYGMQ